METKIKAVEKTYPCIMHYNKDGNEYLVLMRGYSTGTLIHIERDKNLSMQVGYYSTGWIMNEFVIFKGIVELKG